MLIERLSDVYTVKGRYTRYAYAGIIFRHEVRIYIWHGLGDGYANPFGYGWSKSRICMASYLNQLTVCRVVRPERPKALATLNGMITPPPAARSAALSSGLQPATAWKTATR